MAEMDRIASKEVIIHLVKTKCMPVLLCGLDVCPVNAAECNSSLDIALFRLCAKVFESFFQGLYY